VVLNPELLDYEALLKQLNTGASVEVGVLVPSVGKGQRIELKAQTVKTMERQTQKRTPAKETPFV